MRYNTIIMDFDGTIVDTRKSIIKTVKETLKKFGITSINEDLVEKLIGLPLKTTFEEIAGLKGLQLDNAISKYRALYNKISLNSIKFFPNVENTLKKLYKTGITLTIVSNRGKNVLNKLISHLKIDNLFSFVLGAQDVINKKPAPDAVNLIIEKLKTKAAKILVVGDTVFDIEMGRRAKCDTCAVSYGYHGIEDLKSALPNYIIDDFFQILNII